MINYEFGEQRLDAALMKSFDRTALGLNSPNAPSSRSARRWKRMGRSSADRSANRTDETDGR